ncbi:Inosine-5'-monophosphate dehydrogenase [compost metagenome]
MRVRDVMTTEVWTVTPSMTIQEVLEVWEKHRVSGFPVVDGDRVVGIVTEGDLIFRDRPLKPPAYLFLLDGLIQLDNREHVIEEIKKTVGAHVRDVMTSPVVTVSPDADIAEAASLMADRGFNRLPVVDASGRLAGIISRADIVRTLIKS